MSQKINGKQPLFDKLIVTLAKEFTTRSLLKVYKALFSILMQRETGDILVEKQYWDTAFMDWNKQKPPARPTEQEINAYEDFLKMSSNPKNILLLGSTPELRDLLSSWYGTSNIFIADFSISMLNGLMKFTRKASMDQEIWVKTDWLNSALPKKFFDIIVGDLVLQQYVPAKEKDFFEAISMLLGEKGLFITRVNVTTGQFKNISLKTLFSNARPSDKNGEVPLLYWKIRDKYAGDSNRSMDFDFAIQELKQFILAANNEADRESALRIINRLFMDQKKNRWRYAFPTEEQLRASFNSFFDEISRARDENTVDFPSFPILLLAKKQCLH